ncbi:MAG: cell division protein FtsA [Verrucomicrobia bacterium]|nr:cell division protein FtsA [Verrucomicrobiota bacterium]
MALPPVVGLEIGTTKTIALVGELRDDGFIMITGMGERPSTGIRKGEIIDLENASLCVRSVLEMAEESSKVSIREVLLAISGGHIQGVVNRGTVPVFDKDGEITTEDIEQVMEVARAVNLPPEREIMHTISQHFLIDNQQRVINPEGMEGAQISVDMLVLHGVRNRLNNTVRVVRSVPVDVQDVAFSGLCSAMSVLTPEQKKSGAVVIDLGGGTTDYVAYAEGIVAAVGSLGVGGDHVSNDVAAGFNIPLSQAESLKREAGSATVKHTRSSEKLSLPAEGGFPARTIKLKALHTVINARMDEIIKTIHERMVSSEITHHLGAGVVLTGGGAHLPNVIELVEEQFGLPCVVGKPRNISGLATALSGPEYATASGLVQYGFKTARENQHPLPVPGWMKRLFSR